MQEELIVTLDDLRPSCLDGFSFFLEIKKLRPDFKMTCFVTSKWKDKEEEDIIKSPRFQGFARKNRGWVEFALHGVNHGSPPEFLEDFASQKLTIASSFLAFRSIGLRPAGLKPPGYQMDDNTAGATLGLNYIVSRNNIIFLFKTFDSHLVKIKKPNSFLESHIGAPWLDDDIKRPAFQEQLSQKIRDFKGEFLTVAEWANKQSK